MLLIERSPAEARENVVAFLDALVRQLYSRKPEWLEYDLRESYRFREKEFVHIFCAAGSVHARLAQHASSGTGIARDILELGTRDGNPVLTLIHKGQTSEHDAKEMQEIGEPPAGGNAE